MTVDNWHHHGLGEVSALRRRLLSNCFRGGGFLGAEGLGARDEADDSNQEEDVLNSDFRDRVRDGWQRTAGENGSAGSGVVKNEG